VIIKVVELTKIDEYTSIDDSNTRIKRDHRYTLTESYLNTDHVVSFREADPTFYEDQLPRDLNKDQRFTYITLAENRRGMTVVCSPTELQKKINKTSEANLLRG